MSREIPARSHENSWISHMSWEMNPTHPKCPKSWKLFTWNFHQETIYWACYRSELNEHNSKNVLSRNPRPNPWIIRCLKSVLSHSDQRVATWNQSLKLTCWEPVMTGVHSRTRGETMVEFLPSRRKEVMQSKFEFTLYCVYCMLCEWKKSTTQGKRIPSTQKPPDIITSGSIIRYFRKHINLLSAILRREFLEQCAKQPKTTVQASKQASLHGQACNS